MPPILVFNALSYGLTALLAITFIALAVLALISLGKEARTGEPLRDLFPFAMVIATLCVLLSLLTA